MLVDAMNFLTAAAFSEDRGLPTREKEPTNVI
jgi:hypothetical protein